MIANSLGLRLEFISMKNYLSFALLGAAALMTSCGTPVLPESSLSENERSLLSAINQSRQAHGKAPLEASKSLTDLARKDAQRRVGAGNDYEDQRGQTGYERLLTLSGRGRGGSELGSDLMAVWRKTPLQKQLLEGSFSGVGVGTATGANGLETGVVLLGGF